jgi:hypothetical protein
MFLEETPQFRGGPALQKDLEELKEALNSKAARENNQNALDFLAKNNT